MRALSIITITTLATACSTPDLLYIPQSSIPTQYQCVISAGLTVDAQSCWVDGAHYTVTLEPGLTGNTGELVGVRLVVTDAHKDHWVPTLNHDEVFMSTGDVNIENAWQVNDDHSAAYVEFYSPAGLGVMVEDEPAIDLTFTWPDHKADMIGFVEFIWNDGYTNFSSCFDLDLSQYSDEC